MIRSGRRAVIATFGAAVTAGVYATAIRPRVLGWGATPEEVRARMPGDELVPKPNLVSTRAVGIDAPPGDVWPWLVQMGSGRGGAYTYDWIENLFGLDMHSADTILPEFQSLAVGDTLPLGSKGPVMRVMEFEPERALVFQSNDLAWVWAFTLRPAAGGTRLVSRNRILTPGSSVVGGALYRWVMEPGSLVMERKMLQGIRQRAERGAPTPHGDVR